MSTVPDSKRLEASAWTNHSKSTVGFPAENQFFYALAECSGFGRPPAENEAIARRMAACWNACIGLSTAEIEQGEATGTLRLMREVREMIVQRDELLVSLIECADELRFKPSDGTPAVRARALAVIAKVQR